MHVEPLEVPLARITPEALHNEKLSDESISGHMVNDQRQLRTTAELLEAVRKDVARAEVCLG